MCYTCRHTFLSFTWQGLNPAPLARLTCTCCIAAGVHHKGPIMNVYLQNGDDQTARSLVYSTGMLKHYPYDNCNQNGGWGDTSTKDDGCYSPPVKVSTTKQNDGSWAMTEDTMMTYEKGDLSAGKPGATKPQKKTGKYDKVEWLADAKQVKIVFEFENNGRNMHLNPHHMDMQISGASLEPVRYSKVGTGLCKPYGIRVLSDGDNVVDDQSCAAACAEQATPVDGGSWSDRGAAVGFAVGKGWYAGKCYCQHSTHTDACYWESGFFDAYEFTAAGTSSSLTVPTTAFDPTNCPHGEASWGTCWGDSAYQMCPKNRQAAYEAVIENKQGDDKAMHAAYMKLMRSGKFGCSGAGDEATVIDHSYSQPIATERTTTNRDGMLHVGGEAEGSVRNGNIYSA